MKKILLLHGWNYRNYTKMTDKKDAWHNREELVKKLSKNYEVYKLNFPGFCGEKEPKKAWNLSNYAEYVYNYLKENNLKVDYILGYSFGGAVAVTYNRIYDNNQKLILISPAIVRNNAKSKKYMKTPKIVLPLRNLIRDFYLINIVKNPEMKYGTKFLRNTYQKIVRVELIEEVKKIKPKNIKIIYGNKDSMVNPKLVISSLPEEYKKQIYVIDGGGHDIANTHPDKLIEIIDK